MPFPQSCLLLVLLSSYFHVSLGIWHTPNSAYGIFAALALPIYLPPRNCFYSYNFEANYNLPATWGIPPVALGLEEEEFFPYRERQLSADDCANCTTIETASEAAASNITLEESRERRSLITRTNVYYFFWDKFKRSGFRAKHCLLRLICDVNDARLGQHNGVLGDLIHVLFSPSSSMDEHLPLVYYQAEQDGINGQCERYWEECEDNILDLISKPFDEIIAQMHSKYKK